jgi:DDE family transposase
VHLVAAYAHQTHLVLAQAETAGKGHELAGVQAVLAALPGRLLSGRVVTGDALLAPRALCRHIVRKGGTISSS